MSDLTGARILIVDDSHTNVLLLERILEKEGFTNVASTTRSSEVVELFEHSAPDLLLLDLQMPEPDGFAVMELVKPWTAAETYVPILVLTADASAETRRRALAAGARDFLSKPLDAIEVVLRIRNMLEVRQLLLELQVQNEALEDRVNLRTWELERSRLEAFQRLALAAEYRDDETREHTQRVGLVTAALATEMGLDLALIEVLAQVAPLHDLGKIGISDSILLKPGRLNDDEFATMKEHSQIGAEILSGTSSPLFEMAAEIALTHHERWDGSGYPAGLAGEAIPLPGRIVALADAFDAMTHARPYKSAMPCAEALAEIDRSCGSHFDPTIVEAFRRLDADALLTAQSSPRLNQLTPAAWRKLAETGNGAAGETAAIDALLESAFEHTPTAALITDDQRRCVAANSAARRLLNLELEELLALRMDDLMAASAQHLLDNQWKEFLEAGVVSSDYAMVTPDGRTIEVRYRSVANILPGRHLSLLAPNRNNGHQPTTSEQA